MNVTMNDTVKRSSIAGESRFPYDAADSKTCQHCRKVYPRIPEHFYRNRAMKDGLTHLCRACLRLEAEKRRLKRQSQPKKPPKRRLLKPTKKCTGCHEFLPRTLDYFEPYTAPKNGKVNPKNRDGLSAKCRACRQASENKKIEKAKNIRKQWEAVTHRPCSQCGAVKPLHRDYFPVSKREPSGYGSQCRACKAKESAARNAKPEARVQARRNEKKRKEINPIGEGVKRRAKKQRRRIRRMGGEGVVTPQEIAKRLQEQNNQCFYCEVELTHAQNTPTQMTVEHVIPLVKGGKHHIDNIVCTCRQCNNRKSSIFPWIWLELTFCEWLKKDLGHGILSPRYEAAD